MIQIYMPLFCPGESIYSRLQKYSRWFETHANEDVWKYNSEGRVAGKITIEDDEVATAFMITFGHQFVLSEDDHDAIRKDQAPWWLKDRL